MNRWSIVFWTVLGLSLVVLSGARAPGGGPPGAHEVAAVSRQDAGETPAAAPAPSTGKAEYVGMETCKQCHDAQWQKLMSTSHGRASLDPKATEHSVDCEACHGPGSLHVAAGGDKSDPGFATIRNFKSMKPAAVAAVCTSCHKGGDQLYWAQSRHARKNLDCLSCHSVHSSAPNAQTALLKTADPTQLCFSCHRDKRALVARTAHMPLREGMMNCASCHNPHGSPAPRMLRAASTNDLCYQCHADKRGPMLWEHPPVRENCTTCHDPHGSNNDKVLASRRPFLCQQCHVATRHPATLYDQPDLASNRLFNRSCTNCHSQIHGSNHPSGKFFLR